MIIAVSVNHTNGNGTLAKCFMYAAALRLTLYVHEDSGSGVWYVYSVIAYMYMFVGMYSVVLHSSLIISSPGCTQHSAIM